MSNGHFFEDPSIGRTASLARTIIEATLPLGTDTDSVPLDAAAAKRGSLSNCVARGLVTAGLTAGEPGTKSGPDSIPIRRSSRLVAPVKIRQKAQPTAHDENVIEEEARVRGHSRG
jgi:hypothetical protein